MLVETYNGEECNVFFFLRAEGGLGGREGLRGIGVGKRGEMFMGVGGGGGECMLYANWCVLKSLFLHVYITQFHPNIF